MEMKSGDDVDVSVLRVEKIDEMPPDEHRCCQTGGGGWRCKNFRINHDDDSVFKSIYCEKHYYGESEKWKNGTRVLERGNKVSEEDETGGIQQITCDDITADAIVEGDSTKFVTKNKNGKRSGGLKPLTKPVVETRAAKRRKMAMEGDLILDETTNQPATDDNCVSDPIVECGSADDIQRKKKNVKRTKRSGELKSPTRAKEGVVELEKMGNYKMKCLELSLKLERKKLECTKLQSKLVEVEETRKTAETERTPADAAASWEKMFSYLESRYQTMDNGNSTTECVESRISNLESLFLRMESKCSTMAGCVESRMSKLENENSAMGCLESRISNLEGLVQNGNLTMAVESRILKLESLVLRRKESSILRCGELRSSENIESEVLGLQNGVSGTDQKQRDNRKRRKPNAETSSRGRMDSHANECKTKEKVLNVYDVVVSKHHESESEFPKYSAVKISSGCLHLSSGRENLEEGNGRGCSDLVQSQHGSLSQDQLDSRKKLSVNLVSENGSQSFGKSEDSDTSTDSGTSLGSLMDMLAMKYRDKNENKEMKWKSEADMLSSIEEDPKLCMRAVCALRRQQIYEDEMSEKGLFLFSDVLRITTLANFLMEEDCKGDLKKSLKELEIFDPEGVVDCKRMARSYSFQLFSVYQKGKDPFFLPATTASRGD